MPLHHLYIVRCADGTLYTGYARDVNARVALHNAGRGAKYTAGRRPVALVHTEAFDTQRAAMQRECEVKRWPRARKDALTQSAALAQGSTLATARPRP